MDTSKIVKWASQHDWFIDSYKSEGITMIECVPDPAFDGVEPVVFPATAEGFKKLREWAGY